MSTPCNPLPEPAATLVLVRDGTAGLEVFLQQRHHNIPFLGGAHVFPGGKVEPSDSAAHWAARSALSDAQASAELGLARSGLGYWIAAIRECFEESGILMAHSANGQVHQGKLIGWPAPTADFYQLCQQYALELATTEMTYYAHWITPAHLPKRFDTRFFIARAPLDQEGGHDGHECIDSCWITPGAALERQKQRTMTFAPPTFFTLKYLLDKLDVDEAISHAQNNKPIRAILPIFRDNRLLMPDDPGYDEAAAEIAQTSG